MIALIIAIFNWLNLARRETKLVLSVVILDVIALIVVLTTISAITQTIMSPIIAIVGLLWIAATATVIWIYGGVVVDSLLLAGLFKVQAGEIFNRALATFFLIGVSIVTFFLFTPIWAFWSGYFALLVILVGVVTSGALAQKKPNWNIPWKGYIFLMAIIISIMIMAALGVTTEGIKETLKEMGATVRAIPKEMAAETAPTPPSYEIEETVELAPNSIVMTRVWMNAGDRGRFTQETPILYYLEGEEYDVPVISTDITVPWIKPGFITFRGGPKPTRVRIIKFS